MCDKNEYCNAMKIAAYEESVEVGAHLQTALGHFVASGDAVLTDRFANLWAHWQECMKWVEQEVVRSDNG